MKALWRYFTILDAAAQLLDAKGQQAFTANSVAERAGVSIGSLYQYFQNKEAIVLAIAEREEDKLAARAKVERSIMAADDPLRLGLRNYINMLPAHPKTRKAALTLVLQERGAVEIGQEADRRFAEAGAFIGLSGSERFIVSRAIVGVVQSAVLEERADLTSPDFEDGLVRLARSLIVAPA